MRLRQTREILLEGKLYLSAEILIGFHPANLGASRVTLEVKNLPANAGDVGSIPGSGRSPGGGHGNPLQYSCLENLHEPRSLAGYTVHGVAELDTTKHYPPWGVLMKAEDPLQGEMPFPRKAWEALHWASDDSESLSKWARNICKMYWLSFISQYRSF